MGNNNSPPAQHSNVWENVNMKLHRNSSRLKVVKYHYSAAHMFNL